LAALEGGKLSHKIDIRQSQSYAPNIVGDERCARRKR
jgi:hypothetical protein